MSDATLITAEQVETINAARTALKAIADDAHMGHTSQASGMIYALASVAGDDLFQLLNWYDSHCAGDLSAEQVHNK
jgi:peptide methionine sulfoxide reductase MsrB